MRALFISVACVFVGMTACGVSDRKVTIIEDAIGGAPSGAGGASESGSSPGSGGRSSAGGAGPSAGGATPATDMDAAIDTFAATVCGRLEDCRPAVISFNYGDVAGCAERQRIASNWLKSLPDVSMTPASIRTCAASWRSATCVETFDPGLLPGCEDVGTRRDGDPCNAGQQCASGLCDQTGYACGVCASAPGSGDPCVTGQCLPGLSCMQDSICRPSAGIGGACTDTLTCRRDLVCEDGTCVFPPTEDGAFCDQASGLLCDDLHDLYCGTDGSCFAATPVGLGETCGSNGRYCEKHGICSGGICTPGPNDDGGACSPTDSNYCVWPAVCISGACQLPTGVPLCADDAPTPSAGN